MQASRGLLGQIAPPENVEIKKPRNATFSSLHVNISNSTKFKITEVFLVITTIFPFDLESYIVIHAGQVHETFYKTRRVLQGISEQKRKPPSSPAPLSL